MKITFKHKLPNDGTEVEYDLTEYVIWLVTHRERATEIMDLLLAHEREDRPGGKKLLLHLLKVALEEKNET